MMKTLLKSAVCLAALTTTLTVALAQTAQPAAQASTQPAPQQSAFEQFAKDVKNPTPWLTWGGDVRLRNEYLNNAITLDDGALRHEQDYFRFRERIWTTITPVTNLTLNARLAAEQREWMKPTYASQYFVSSTVSRSGLEERYGILDNANLKWNNAFNLPLTITAGRQDIMFGDPLNWWLVADGTPGDGSWTFFLDSIRLTFDAKDIKTKFDLVYIYQNALPDEWIPTIGRSGGNTRPNGSVKPYYLTEQNEQGVIFYVSNKSLKNTQVDGYFIYKRDSRELPLLTIGDNADIYTLGAKITGQPTPHWAYSVEGAYQFGHKQDLMVLTNYTTSPSAWRDISAYGANAKLSYLFKDKLNNQASLIFEYLSGDDPNTKGTDEMFDILWGRWPRWSELYIYSYGAETSGKLAQLNNIMRIGPSWSFVPIKDTTLSVTYNALFAPEETPTRAVGAAPGTTGSLFTGNGDFRGHFLQAWVKHQFSKRVSGHLWSEFVWQGDYYAKRDMLTFLRAELMMTF